MALPVPAVARGDKVEVGQEYFQALFMRAHLCPPYDPSDPSLVRIQMSEYDFLTRALSEYRKLTANFGAKTF
ncbi:hypothetical protein NpNSSI1_00000044 [Neofusicoccum parvum]|nr:hypothetical protein NpNSSI1_00000044 [Neofusicoccum parvum]